MPSLGTIELSTHLLEAKLAEFLAVYYIQQQTWRWDCVVLIVKLLYNFLWGSAGCRYR